MKSALKMALAMALTVLAGAAPAWAQQTASERADLARYQRYAGPPVDHIRYFQIDGFQYLAPDKLAIRFAVNQMVLVTVQTPCTNLAFTNAIGLTSRDHTLYSGFDFVTFDHQRCKILRIEPVDELRMKQDAAKAAAAPDGKR